MNTPVSFSAKMADLVLSRQREKTAADRALKIVRQMARRGDYSGASRAAKRYIRAGASKSVPQGRGVMRLGTGSEGTADLVMGARAPQVQAQASGKPLLREGGLVVRKTRRPGTAYNTPEVRDMEIEVGRNLRGDDRFAELLANEYQVMGKGSVGERQVRPAGRAGIHSAPFTFFEHVPGQPVPRKAPRPLLDQVQDMRWADPYHRIEDLRHENFIRTPGGKYRAIDYMPQRRGVEQIERDMIEDWVDRQGGRRVVTESEAFDDPEFLREVAKLRGWGDAGPDAVYAGKEKGRPVKPIMASIRARVQRSRPRPTLTPKPTAAEREVYQNQLREEAAKAENVAQQQFAKKMKKYRKKKRKWTQAQVASTLSNLGPGSRQTPRTRAGRLVEEARRNRRARDQFADMTPPPPPGSAPPPPPPPKQPPAPSQVAPRKSQQEGPNMAGLPPEEAERRRRMMLFAAAAGGAGVLGAGAYFMARGRGAGEPPQQA